jgi:short-subunit dehydrogenase involved in D-alanine esterification of teichoic acids
MKISGNTILITDGNAGIGLAFTERFIHAVNKVIVCGRLKNVLQVFCLHQVLTGCALCILRLTLAAYSKGFYLYM